MNVFIYNGTFEGFLTAIFDAYEMKIVPDKIISSETEYSLFPENYYHIPPDKVKSDRVWNGLKKKVSENTCKMIFTVFLSESAMEKQLYDFICKIFDTPYNIESNMGDANILNLRNVERRVQKEAVRMIEFIRFQKMADDIFFASISPAYDILPLLIKHFESRFTDQKWIVYDLKRDYGIFYNLKETVQMTIPNLQVSHNSGQVSEEAKAVDEKLFQSLWQDYFDSINIKERKNAKLQKQFMPVRYWKFMPEKNRLR